MVSAGAFRNNALLELNHEEDKEADWDDNFVITEDGEFVELQGAGEETTFSPPQFAELLALGQKGVAELCVLQRAAVRATQPDAGRDDIKALADFFAKR